LPLLESGRQRTYLLEMSRTAERTDKIPIYRIADFEGQGRFVDKLQVGSDAASVVSNIRRLFSDKRYAGGHRSLSVRWVQTEQFRAAARTPRGQADDHEILISYGAAYELYKDAFIFTQICENHFSTPHYDSFFEAIRSGEGRDPVIPGGLDADGAKSLMFEISVAWLYLHEQSHLFQGHTAIASESAPAVAAEAAIEELDADGSATLAGEDAAVSHAFELSADHEATSLVVQYLMYRDGGALKTGSAWLMVAALMCMFQRFYGGKGGPVEDTAEGTHPNPGFRMRMAVLQIQELLDHPKVQQFVPWAESRERVFDLLHHAVICASVFWELRYRQDEGFPAFMRHGFEEETPASYRGQLSDTWNDLRPRVLERYFGWGEDTILPPLKPDWLA
jgi:hypothetical protein